jgi:hypothetical protein
MLAIVYVYLLKFNFLMLSGFREFYTVIPHDFGFRKMSESWTFFFFSNTKESFVSLYYREKEPAPYNHHHLTPSQAMRGWILHEQDLL